MKKSKYGYGEHIPLTRKAKISKDGELQIYEVDERPLWKRIRTWLYLQNPFAYKCMARILYLVLLDQTIKFLVHYFIPANTGEIQIIGSWVRIVHVLNPGMAFGLEIMGPYGKLILTAYRASLVLTATFFFAVALNEEEIKRVWIKPGILLLGGAIGNLIDNVFYGLWLNNAPSNAALRLFYGQVIDMFSFGPRSFNIPVFNVADICIALGMIRLGISLFKYIKNYKTQTERTTNVFKEEYRYRGF